MAITLIVTDAGRAALVNADNTGTAPVTIAQVGLSATAVVPSKTATNLPGEFKRLSTISGEVVADDTIHMIVRDEGTGVFTVRSFALYLADGTLFAIYGQADVVLEKSAQAMMLLAVDVRFADISAAALTFGDANFLNPPATTEQIGVVELATLAETIAGTDDRRTPAAKMVKDAVFAWLDARFGANNAGIWHPGNDGSGSGLDADLLDGQHGSYYTAIPARLGYTPVQQGTGNGQLGNIIKIGWSNANRLKATVDTTDQGNFVFDSHIGDVWRASNDGAGSGLDADLLDGQDGTYYTNIVARLGYTPLDAAGYTASDIRTKLLTVDGAGSGLDADLLDGRDSSAYAILASPGLFTGALKTASVNAFLMKPDANGNNRTVIHRNDGSAYYILVTDPATSVSETFNALRPFWIDLATGVLNSTNGQSFSGGTYINGSIAWHAGNDGAGSGLDADLLDGQDSAYYTNIVARLGYTPLNQATYTAANVLSKLVTVDGSGSGLDADTVDGYQASAFDRVTSASYGASGQRAQADGYKKCWGSITIAANSSATVTMPITFGATPRVIVSAMARSSTTDQENGGLLAGSEGTSTFTIVNGFDFSSQFAWEAFGQ